MPVIETPKILCLFSAPLLSPSGIPLSTLDFEKEKNTIIRELTACKQEIQLQIGIASIDELARGLADEYNILHISGHGDKDSIIFEDGKGGSHSITGDYLKKLIGTSNTFELAIVSACHSERIGRLLNGAGIKHVIAIRCDYPVLDAAATAFVGQFFRNLFRGDSIQKSFEMAKLLVEGNPELSQKKPLFQYLAEKNEEKYLPEENKFLLLPSKPKSHLDPLVSKSNILGQLKIKETALSKTNLPGRFKSYTGRSNEMHELINLIFTNRFVTITGAGGIGKTTVAVEVARWFHSRGYFLDGIYYLNLRDTKTIGGFIGVLSASIEIPLTETKEVVHHLAQKNCLLLLDNAEDILWNYEMYAQEFINTILKFNPNIKFLITSQRAFGGNLHEPERLFRMRILDDINSERLFIENAKRDVTKDEWESKKIHELLNELGGHPLSIVVMARQLGSGTSIDDLLERIKSHKSKAISLKKDTDKHHHNESLHIALSSAHEHLSENAKNLFGILTLLPAGAQDFIIKEIAGYASWDAAQELYDASLVEINEINRVFMLAPVRLYALTVVPDDIRRQYGPKTFEAMVNYSSMILANIRAVESKMYDFLFTLDEPNFTFALSLPIPSSSTTKEPSALAVLSTNLIQIYTFKARFKDGSSVAIHSKLKVNEINDKYGLADINQAHGDLALRTVSLAEARNYFSEALGIYKHIDSKIGEANSYLFLSIHSIIKSEIAVADNYLHMVSDIASKIELQQTINEVVLWNAIISIFKGDEVTAKKQLNDFKIIRERLFDFGNISIWLTFMSEKLIHINRVNGATLLLEYAEIYAKKANDTRLERKVAELKDKTQ